MKNNLLHGIRLVCVGRITSFKPTAEGLNSGCPEPIQAGLEQCKGCTQSFPGQLVAVPPRAGNVSPISRFIPPGSSRPVHPARLVYPARKGRGQAAVPRGHSAICRRRRPGSEGALGARRAPVRPSVLPSVLPSFPGDTVTEPNRHRGASSTKDSQDSLWPPRANVQEQISWTKRGVKVVLVYERQVPLTARVKFTDCNHKMRSVPGFIGFGQLYAVRKVLRRCL